MSKIKQVRELCVPHDDLHDLSLSDTVLDISALALPELPKILEPGYFFERNVFTRAGQRLTSQAFSRLSGASGEGVFLLSDGMGGGKTHSILSLGLLARFPEFRKTLIPEAAHPELGSIRVVTFDGRNSNQIFWESLGRQLGIESRVAPFLDPIQPIGKDKWGEILADLGPVIIAIDELPPYLDAAESREIGSSNLARITATTLSNLIRGISAGGALSRVVLVMTDLASTAYENAKGGWESVDASETTSNLRQEVDQVAVRLQPVDNQGRGELYEILRRRSFKKLPGEAEVRKVAEARRDILRDADADWGTEQVNTYVSSVVDSYPFDPHLTEILYRTKDAQGFQSTRRLVRVMQTLVNEIYRTGSDLADVELIGPQHLSPSIDLVRQQVANVNAKLEAAIIQGISDGGRSAAEMIDKQASNPKTKTAERIATLILWGSLSSAGAKPGVTEDEIITICLDGQTGPDDIERSLRALVEDCHYLYQIGEGSVSRYHFRDTENVRAAIAKRAENLVQDQWRDELARRLTSYLRPTQSLVYNDCMVFPSYDRISISPSKRTLIVLFPDADGGAEARARAWWKDRLEFKNQVLFVYADRAQLEEIERTSRRLAGAIVYEKELRDQGHTERSSQVSEVREVKAAAASNFYQAVTGSFRKLLFPNRGDLQARDIERRDGNGRMLGDTVEAPLEGFVSESIKAAHKFQDACGPNSEFEDRISKQVMASAAISESELQRSIARIPSVPWGPSDALSKLVMAMLAAGRWRRSGNLIEQVKEGERELARVVTPVETVSRVDGVDLIVKTEHADGIEISYINREGKDEKSTIKVSPGVAKTIEAKAASITISPKSSTGMRVGSPVTVKVPAVINAEIKRRGVSPILVARSFPAADLRATFDGTDPIKGKSFTSEIEVPERCEIVRIAAVLDKEKLNETQLTIGSGPALAGACALKGVGAPDRVSLTRIMTALSREDGRVGSLTMRGIGNDGTKVTLRHDPARGGWLDVTALEKIRDAVDLATSHRNGFVSDGLETEMQTGFPSLDALRRFCAESGVPFNEQQIEPITDWDGH